MAGDEDKKKKKKKSKTAEEAPPPPAPEPEPVPEPEPAPVGMDDDNNDDWFASAGDDAGAAPADEQQAAAPPADDEGGFNFDDVGEAVEGGDFLPEGEEGAELPPQPKKKPKYFVHWDRRKAKFYDYNYDYGTNYYASMVGYVDSKNAGHPEVPRRMAFAERGINSALERHRHPDTRTQNLLHDVRSNIRSFENSQRLYAYGKQRV